MVFETAGSELTEAIPPEDFTAYLCAVITRKIPKSNTKKIIISKNCGTMERR